MVQETSFGNDRDQKTKRTATITKGTRGNVSHKVRRQSVSQERGFRSTKGPQQLTSRSRSKEMVTRDMKVREPLTVWRFLTSLRQITRVSLCPLLLRAQGGASGNCWWKRHCLPTVEAMTLVCGRIGHVRCFRITKAAFVFHR